MENENEILTAFIFPDGVTHGAEKNEKNVLLSCPFNDKGLNNKCHAGQPQASTSIHKSFSHVTRRNPLRYLYLVLSQCLIIGC
jgi:hypothetical protein